MVAIRDPKYLAWVRTLPCVACFPEWVHIPWPDRQKSHTEAAHVGNRGLGQKCSDRETLPLCGIEHHRLGPKSHHVLGKAFWATHGLDRDKIIADLNRLYKEERAA